jgi:hypothetical protein
VEGKKASVPSSPIFQFYGNVQSSIIGTQNHAELTANFDFGEIEREIERHGGADTDELQEAVEQVKRLIDEGQILDRGTLARFGEVMRRNSWFTSQLVHEPRGSGSRWMGHPEHLDSRKEVCRSS